MVEKSTQLLDYLCIVEKAHSGQVDKEGTLCCV
jgi:hypothetical protein